MIKQGFIFAAGKGTRMYPLTLKQPKPLIEVNGINLLDRSIQLMVRSGVEKIIINTYYLSDQIMQHVAQVRSLYSGVEIILSQEKQELEMGGAVLYALDLLGGQDFFAINSDVIFDVNSDLISSMNKFWNPEKMDVLLMLHNKETAIGYRSDVGNFGLDGNLVLLPDDPMDKKYVFTGLQILSHKIFVNLVLEKFSLRNIYFAKARQKRTYGLINNSYWLHVGDVDAIKEAEDFLQHI